MAWCRWSLCVCSSDAGKCYLQEKTPNSIFIDISYENIIVDHHQRRRHSGDGSLYFIRYGEFGCRFHRFAGNGIVSIVQCGNGRNGDGLFALAVASTVQTSFRSASLPQTQPPKLRLECSVFAGMNTAERIQQTMRTLAQSLPRLGKSTGICIVSMAMLTMPVDVNAQVQPTPEIILYGTDTVRKHTYDHVAWGIPLVVGRGYWRFVSIESHRTYEPGSRGRLQERHSTGKFILNTR